MKGHPGTHAPLCRFHRRGVPARVATNGFYAPNCPTCADKLARGVVTGTEPHPTTFAKDGKDRMNWIMKAKRNQGAENFPQPRRVRA